MLEYILAAIILLLLINARKLNKDMVNLTLVVRICLEEAMKLRKHYPLPEQKGKEKSDA